MQISATELKARLVSLAKEIGFDSCRVAACTAPVHANDFREWLRDGAHGEMNSTCNAARKSGAIRKRFCPAARSIVALSLNYFQEKKRPTGLLQEERGESRDTLGATTITM